jgi:hypothetical protein
MIFARRVDIWVENGRNQARYTDLIKMSWGSCAYALARGNYPTSDPNYILETLTEQQAFATLQAWEEIKTSACISQVWPEGKQWLQKAMGS